MPVVLDSPASPARGVCDIEIGLLNNLGDAGMESGERQLLDLLGQGCGGARVRLRLFSLPAIERGAEARDRTNQLLAQFHLSERAASYPSQLSGGLAQRVQIARAIAHRPKVLFLDEPSAGLDPQSRIALWDSVRALRGEGITVVLTTHYMEEADELCERVAIIDHGKILVEDTPAALKASVGAGKIYELDLHDDRAHATLPETLRGLAGVTAVEPTRTGVRVFAQPVDGLLSDVVRSAAPLGLRALTITEPSLETVFIRLTGRELRE